MRKTLALVVMALLVACPAYADGWSNFDYDGETSAEPVSEHIDGLPTDSGEYKEGQNNGCTDGTCGGEPGLDGPENDLTDREELYGDLEWCEASQSMATPEDCEWFSAASERAATGGEGTNPGGVGDVEEDTTAPEPLSEPTEKATVGTNTAPVGKGTAPAPTTSQKASPAIEDNDTVTTQPNTGGNFGPKAASASIIIIIGALVTAVAYHTRKGM